MEKLLLNNNSHNIIDDDDDDDCYVVLTFSRFFHAERRMDSPAMALKKKRENEPEDNVLVRGGRPASPQHVLGDNCFFRQTSFGPVFKRSSLHAASLIRRRDPGASRRVGALFFGVAHT